MLVSPTVVVGGADNQPGCKFCSRWFDQSETAFPEARCISDNKVTAKSSLRNPLTISLTVLGSLKGTKNSKRKRPDIQKTKTSNQITYSEQKHT